MVVGVAFGCVWGIAGAIALPSPWNVWGVGLSIGISAALVAALAMLPARRKSVAFRGQVYGVAVALEAAGIGIAVWSLRHLPFSSFSCPRLDSSLGSFHGVMESNRYVALPLGGGNAMRHMRRRGILAWRNRERRH